MFSDPVILTTYADTILAALLALAVVVLKRGTVAWMLFALGMLLLAIESALGVAVLRASTLSELVGFYRWRQTVGTPLVGVWLAFSICYSRADYAEALRRSRWLLFGAIAVPALAVSAYRDQMVWVGEGADLPLKILTLGPSGTVAMVALLLGNILILVNLERTFRSAIGVMRWRIKYLFFGAGLLFGAKVYTSSQALLYSSVQGLSVRVEALALLVGGVLMGYSFFRTRLTESEIYPSQRMLQQSITILIAGGYLVVVGGLAKIANHFGGGPSFLVKALVLMLLLVVLSILLLSNSFQQTLKLFVSRHFARPTHDYRKVWAACTQRTGLATERIDLSQALAGLISDTFEVLSVTVWLTDENRRTITFGASTCLLRQQAAELLNGMNNPEAMLDYLRTLPGPLNLDHAVEQAALSLGALTPDQFRKGGNRICVPLLSDGEPVGFVTLADRVNGRPFSIEDLDLLTCIANQVAGAFRNFEMSQALVQSKELQAFQAMSAFFIHDLRNSAFTLSLMVKNLQAHFGNPEFREDCLRSLNKSVEHINDLIKRLTILRQELELKEEVLDINQVLTTATRELGLMNGLEVSNDFQLGSKVSADPEQLRKVITNLLLNAREAVDGHGQINVGTHQRDKWAVITVTDSGCGMSRDFIDRFLFRPFQTTKKNGMGIGMFHTRAIVEAHRGRIEVESEPGKGSTFRVLLPLSDKNGR